jgi:hypothetical protein
MIADNILRLRERINLVCSRINRDPNSIKIVAVCKGRAVGKIKEAILAGITEIGENKVQEALTKYNDLQFATPRLHSGQVSDKQIKWHMVGHLQTNKVKEALKIFDLIQSVDSLHLAQEIDKQAARINKIQDILIEVNTSGETAKFGFKPDETIEAIKEIAKLKNVSIKGLMTIAPVVDDSEKTRPYFRHLRKIFGAVNQLPILSIGMTDDFEVAIEEGSNMIRLGRAIFG